MRRIFFCVGFDWVGWVFVGVRDGMGWWMRYGGWWMEVGLGLVGLGTERSDRTGGGMGDWDRGVLGFGIWGFGAHSFS